MHQRLTLTVLAITATTLLAQGCTKTEAPTPTDRETPAETAPAEKAGTPGKAAFTPPDEGTIPDGPLGDSIRRGKELLTDTRARLPDNVGNGMNCTSCHLDAGRTPGAAPWVGVTAVFPQYRSRGARVITLQERVNACFQRSMNGKPLDPTGDDMNAIMSYMTWLSTGVPIGTSVEGRGFVRFEPPAEPDADRGEAVYAAQCASCHGADGQGMKGPDDRYMFPPLWGPDSFNIAAGMARLKTAAAFVRGNMPLGQGGTLSEQEAYDVSLYFTQKPRPDFAAKDKDWPKGGKPSDARY